MRRISTALPDLSYKDAISVTTDKQTENLKGAGKSLLPAQTTSPGLHTCTAEVLNENCTAALGIPWHPQLC